MNVCTCVCICQSGRETYVVIEVHLLEVKYMYVKNGGVTNEVNCRIAKL